MLRLQSCSIHTDDIRKFRGVLIQGAPVLGLSPWTIYVCPLLTAAERGPSFPPSRILCNLPRAMETTERPASVGYSDLFPVLPLFSLVSLICCLLVLPAFIKTRVLALTTLTLWIALGDLVICINMCVWRNNTRNIPIYSDFVAHLWDIYTITIYLNMLCFHKFVWNMTRPGSSLKVYDNRIKYNRLDIILTTIPPILWTPVMLITLDSRYMIIEDIGPVYTVSLSSLAVLIRCVPILLITIASAWFVVSTMINVWRARHIEPPKGVNEPGHLRFDRTLPRKKVTKYMALSIWTLISVVFGCIWAFMPALLSPSPWYAKPDIRGNIRQLPLIHTASRYEVDPNVAGSRKLFFISIPVMGIVIFVFFGLGLEALKTYHSWLRTLFLLLKLPTLFNFLRIHTLRLGSWNQRVIPVNPEYFAPFESEDINLDPHSPADLPKASRRSSARTFPDIPLKIQPSSHPAPLRGSRLSKNPLGSPLEEWRMHHKQPSITEPNPIPQSPAFSPFKLRWNDKQGFMVSNRWISYHKKPISPRYGPQTSTFPSPDRPHFSVDSSPTVPRSNSQRMPQLIIGSQWVSSIGQPTCYDGLPPPYRPPVDRGSTSDPLSDLF